jgi:hypothetical protein
MDIVVGAVIFFPVIILLILIGWIIYRVSKKGEWINPGSRFVGRSVYTDFQNEDNKEAIEHVIYVEEDDREEAFVEGDDDKGDNKK